MNSINVSQDDYDFLAARASEQECSVEESVEQMILRERVLAKARPVTFDAPTPNIEPPHRKWGM